MGHMASQNNLPAVPNKLIQTREELMGVVGHLRASGRFAFDTEFIGENSYHPVLCLVQVATEDRVELIDPMAVRDLSPLWDLMGRADIEKILVEILDLSENDLRPMSLDELRRNVCATIACRAAIKINTRLEPKKIEWLLGSLAACEYPMTCPHGRPIALRYSTKDILKSFHRI